MAQVRGTFAPLYDNLDKVVFAGFGTTLKELPSRYKSYFRMETSDRKFERRLPLAGFTVAPQKAEGADYQTQFILPGNSVDFTHLEFGLAFEVTQTAEEDDQYGVISDNAAMLARSCRVTEETYAILQFNSGFSGGTVTSPDGQPLYSNSHVLITGGGTKSNVLNADLSYASLTQGLALLHTDGVSEEGHYVDPPDGWILEVAPAFEFIAERLVESAGLPGSTDNDTNPIKNRYSISVLVNPYITPNDAWRLIAKNRMHGLISYTRVAIGMQPPVRIPSSDNRLYKARFRRSWGNDRWQGLVGSTGG